MVWHDTDGLLITDFFFLLNIFPLRNYWSRFVPLNHSLTSISRGVPLSHATGVEVVVYLFCFGLSEVDCPSISPQVTHRTTGETMVLKELYRVDEEAQSNFLKEVRWILRLKRILIAFLLSYELKFTPAFAKG